MNYRYGKRPKIDITASGNRREISIIEDKILGKRAETQSEIETVRRWMQCRTAGTIVAELGCHHSLIKLYERRFKVRAMRQCKHCKNALPFDQMHLNSIGQTLSCEACFEARKKKPVLKGRALDFQEYTEVPSVVYQSCRMRISDAEGINGWMRPQVGVVA